MIKSLLNILTTFFCLLFIFYIWRGMIIIMLDEIKTKYQWLSELLVISVYIVGGMVIIGIFGLICYLWSL